MRSYNISDLKDKKLSLRLKGTLEKIKIGLVFGSTSEISVPNTVYDSYEVKQDGDDEYEYPLILDKLNNMFKS